MENITEKCMLRETCKNKDSEKCNRFCYPFVVLHGQQGNGGFWRTSCVPAKYKEVVKSGFLYFSEGQETLVSFKITL